MTTKITAANAHVPSRRELKDLTVAEVGVLMDSVNLDSLRDVFLSHKVTGRLLSYCEEAGDLLEPEYGVTSKAVARGLLQQIIEWKENGVLL